MFVLRCIFWLSIVYASMSWPKGAFDAGDLGAPLRTQGAAAAHAVADTAIAEAAEMCRGNPAACATDAGRLTALLAKSTAGDDRTASIATRNEPAIAPARALRRHGRDGRVAPAP